MPRSGHRPARLGPGLREREKSDVLRAEIWAVIAHHRFRAVFQPIVSLDDGLTVAYEALTRFDDDVPPERRFAEAAAVGLSPELEQATLAMALRSARALPPDVPLALTSRQRSSSSRMPFALSWDVPDDRSRSNSPSATRSTITRGCGPPSRAFRVSAGASTMPELDSQASATVSSFSPTRSSLTDHSFPALTAIPRAWLPSWASIDSRTSLAHAW